MKLLFASRLFQDVAGGVERMSISLMNEMVARGHEVELLSWDKAGAETFYPLDKSVGWQVLDCGDARQVAGWSTRAKRLARARKIIRDVRPDAIMAFQHGCFLFMAVAAGGLGIPIIAAERNAPHRLDHTSAGQHRGLIFQSFRLADCVTVQFDDYVQAYPDYLRGKIESIGNPVPAASGRATPEGIPGAPKVLLSVGRLSFQKNQHALITAFARIADQFPEWRLRLVGDGEDEASLKALAEDSGIASRIEFVGAQKDVSSEYTKAHLFCLASRWEGFPNAIAEAMAHGLPCVAFEDCAGMPQLIEHRETGELAPGNGSAEAFATALARLMSDDTERARRGANGRAAIAQYAPQKIFDQWERLFVRMAS